MDVYGQYHSGHVNGDFLEIPYARQVGGYAPLEVPTQDWVDADRWNDIMNGIRWAFMPGGVTPAAGLSQGAPNIGSTISSSPQPQPVSANDISSAETFVLPESGEQPVDEGQSSDGYNHEDENNAIAEALDGGVSLSDFMRDNPGLPALEYVQYMAQHSDEWAEKLVDYYLEKDSLYEANAYTASREDTAYQRLVQDLKKAGLNPAMMYGSSASPSSASSAGYLRLSEGANQRGINSYAKLKDLMLSYMLYALQKGLGIANTVNSFLDTLIPGINISKIFK